MSSPQHPAPTHTQRVTLSLYPHAAARINGVVLISLSVYVCVCIQYIEYRERWTVAMYCLAHCTHAFFFERGGVYARGGGGIVAMTRVCVQPSPAAAAPDYIGVCLCRALIGPRFFASYVYSVYYFFPSRSPARPRARNARSFEQQYIYARDGEFSSFFLFIVLRRPRFF